VLNASRLAAARAAACTDAGASAASLPRGAHAASTSSATAPPLGDVGGEPAGPDRPPALAFHLRLRELADAMAGSCGGDGGAAGAGGGANADEEAAARSLPPVRVLAWSPSGAAGAGGGCLLGLLAAGDQVKRGETPPPPPPDPIPDPT